MSLSPQDRLGVAQSALNDFLREQILEHNRLDLLCEHFLGLTLQPFHKALQIFMLRHDQTLQLAFRGAGKTTSCTISYIILKIIQNRDIRVLIASKTHQFTIDVLKEIKAHLSANERLIEVFGEFKGPKWDGSAIEVLGRTKPQKEPTITTVGAEGQVVGKHYDLILVDDLVDEENARTPYMRDKLKTFYYKTLFPTLEPYGEIHFLGTRYHYNDLYGHLLENEMKDSHQIIPAIGPSGGSPWADRFPADHFIKLRERLGSIIFNSQYQCDTEAMKGEIFDFDWIQFVAPSEVPPDGSVYMGVDVAISEKESSDLFAMCLIKVKGPKIWVLDFLSGHFTFRRQVGHIKGWFERYSPVSIGIESNAYQQALAQEISEQLPSASVKKIFTRVDKVTRAHKLAGKFEAGDVSFVGAFPDLVDCLVSFPSGRFKDPFDALDFAITTAYRKRRGRRTKEPKIL